MHQIGQRDAFPTGQLDDVFEEQGAGHGIVEGIMGFALWEAR